MNCITNNKFVENFKITVDGNILAIIFKTKGMQTKTVS